MPGILSFPTVSIARLFRGRVASAKWLRRPLVGTALAVVLGSLRSLPAHAEAIELEARGVQIYVCERTSDTAVWRLKAPEATLFDAAGAQVGSHFAGPSWRAMDGSMVVGEAVTSSKSSSEGSIPWLVLRAKSHEGDGQFASVDYVVRLQTEGGVAPTAGCDQTHVGTENRIGYRAKYVLFSH